jgi:hypothetical protein
LCMRIHPDNELHFLLFSYKRVLVVAPALKPCTQIRYKMAADDESAQPLWAAYFDEKADVALPNGDVSGLCSCVYVGRPLPVC